MNGEYYISNNNKAFVYGYPLINRTTDLKSPTDFNNFLGICFSKKCKEEKAAKAAAKLAKQEADAAYQTALLSYLQSSDASADSKTPVGMYVIAGLGLIAILGVAYFAFIKPQKRGM